MHRLPSHFLKSTWIVGLFLSSLTWTHLNSKGPVRICDRSLDQFLPQNSHEILTKKSRSHGTNSWSVREQCIDSCAITAHLSLLERLGNRPLDSDYNIILGLLKNAHFLLKTYPEAIARPEGGISPLVIKNEEFQDIKTQGVLFEGEFDLDLFSFFSRMNSGANSPQLSRPRVSQEVSSVMKLHQALGKILAQVYKERMRGLSENQSQRFFYLKKIEKLLQLLSQYNKKATKNYQSLVSDKTHYATIQIPFNEKTRWSYSISSIKRSFLFSPFHWAKKKQIKELIEQKRLFKWMLEKLDEGHTFQIDYYNPPFLFNQETGRSQLELSLDYTRGELKNTMAKWSQYLHSALVIDYQITDEGLPVFIIQDSQGSEVYDQGRVYMDPITFLYSVQAVSTFMKQSDFFSRSKSIEREL